MKIYKSAELPKGFLANGISCGIKKSAKPDLGLILSGYPCKAAAVFTSNKFAAAPVRVSRGNLKAGNKFYGAIVNSGNANCFTGSQGLLDARLMNSKATGILGIKPQNIFVASTGIIGKKLPVHKIISCLPLLIKGLSPEGAGKFSRSILTTDKFTKEVTARINIGSKAVTICGIAKGAGMIFPNMATMLCFIATDANIEAQALRLALKCAIDYSFNNISVDGCQSTNDSVFLLANGLAGNKVISAKNSDYKKFGLALNSVCLELARMIVRDGEGASKLIQIRVCSAKDYAEAKKVGFAIANSNLFKTAMYGEDPNFGRVVQAAGVSGVGIKEENLKINFGPLNKKEIKVSVALGRGKCEAVVYTSDLTPEYIRVNSKYS